MTVNIGSNKTLEAEVQIFATPALFSSIRFPSLNPKLNIFLGHQRSLQIKKWSLELPKIPSCPDAHTSWNELCVTSSLTSLEQKDEDERRQILEAFSLHCGLHQLKWMKASNIYLHSSSSICSSDVYRQQSGWCHYLYSILTHFLAFNLSRFSFYISIWIVVTIAREISIMMKSLDCMKI